MKDKFTPLVLSEAEWVLTLARERVCLLAFHLLCDGSEGICICLAHCLVIDEPKASLEKCGSSRLWFRYVGLMAGDVFLHLHVVEDTERLGQMRFCVSKEFIKFNYNIYNYQKQSSEWYE